MTAENMLSTDPSGGGLVQMVVLLKNFAIGIVGIIASIMVLVGGLQYAGSTSSEGMAKARNTIVYAVLGGLVAYLANVFIEIFLDLF